MSLKGEGQKSERFNKGEDLLEVTHRPLALLDLLLCLWKIDTPQAGEHSPCQGLPNVLNTTNVWQIVITRNVDADRF